MIDLDSLLSSSEVSTPFSTKTIPCPVGTYPFLVEDFEGKVYQGKEDKSKSYPMILVKLKIQLDGPAREIMKQDFLTRTLFIGLDFNEAGGLDSSEGRNVGLGRLRAALKQNGHGTWNFNMLRGAAGRVEIKHEVVKDGPAKGEIRDTLGALSPL